MPINKLTRRKLSPNANYIIWLVFLIILIFPISIPSKISIYNYIDIDDVKYESNEETNAMLKTWEDYTENYVLPENVINFIARNQNQIWKNYIKLGVAYVWSIVFIVKLILKIISCRTINRECKINGESDERAILILNECKERLKIKRNVRVVKQSLMKRPCTIGIFDVKILVTSEFLELDDVSIANVFMHELCHYKRKDNIVNFIIIVLESIYWFNPITYIFFKNIRNNIELATDELAVDKMNIEERKQYCKTMLYVCKMEKVETEMALGMLNNANTKTLHTRIDMISLKEQFEKNFIIIIISTIVIIMGLCFIFYPSSYGIYEIPTLYLENENGERVEAIKLQEDELQINEIKMSKNSKINFVIKNGKTDGYIFYNKLDSTTMQEKEKTANVLVDELIGFEEGEAIYKFTLTYGDNQSMDYVAKIVVE